MTNINSVLYKTRPKKGTIYPTRDNDRARAEEFRIPGNCCESTVRGEDDTLVLKAGVRGWRDGPGEGLPDVPSLSNMSSLRFARSADIRRLLLLPGAKNSVPADCEATDPSLFALLFRYCSFACVFDPKGPRLAILGDGMVKGEEE